MANLDGTDVIKPTPFDAHEQATRGVHVPTDVDSPDLDPEKIAEFPKAVDHVDHPSGVGKEPIMVNSAEEEAAHHEAKADTDSQAKQEPASEEDLVIQQLQAAVDQGSDALFAKDAEIAALNKRVAELEAQLAATS